MSRRFRRTLKPEFDQKVVDIARVTRIVAGGKRFRFRATIVIGDRKGRVGMGIAKGADVTLAVNKAYNKAKKDLIRVPIVNETIPYEAKVKFKGATVFLKPAPKGTGVIAGGPVRAVVELAGIRNIFSKMQGSANKGSNIEATILALRSLKNKEAVAADRGLKLEDLGFKNKEKQDETKRTEAEQGQQEE